MGIDSADLLKRGVLYAQRRGVTLRTDDRLRIGGGQDGSVWLSDRHTAVKVLRFLPLYHRERNAYLRLREHDVNQILGCKVPQLIDFDDDLMVIEMSVVTRPFVLDFAGAYLDSPPDYPPELVEEWDLEKAELFEDLWPKVRAIRAAFRRMGIYLTDLSKTNIALEE